VADPLEFQNQEVRNLLKDIKKGINDLNRSIAESAATGGWKRIVPSPPGPIPWPTGLQATPRFGILETPGQLEQKVLEYQRRFGLGRTRTHVFLDLPIDVLGQMDLYTRSRMGELALMISTLSPGRQAIISEVRDLRQFFTEFSRELRDASRRMGISSPLLGYYMPVREVIRTRYLPPEVREYYQMPHLLESSIVSEITKSVAQYIPESKISDPRLLRALRLYAALRLTGATNIEEFIQGALAGIYDTYMEFVKLQEALKAAHLDPAASEERVKELEERVSSLIHFLSSYTESMEDLKDKTLEEKTQAIRNFIEALQTLGGKGPTRESFMAAGTMLASHVLSGTIEKLPQEQIPLAQQLSKILGARATAVRVIPVEALAEVRKKVAHISLPDIAPGLNKATRTKLIQQAIKTVISELEPTLIKEFQAPSLTSSVVKVFKEEFVEARAKSIRGSILETRKLPQRTRYLSTKVVPNIVKEVLQQHGITQPSNITRITDIDESIRMAVIEDLARKLAEEEYQRLSDQKKVPTATSLADVAVAAAQEILAIIKGLGEKTSYEEIQNLYKEYRKAIEEQEKQIKAIDNELKRLKTEPLPEGADPKEQTSRIENLTQKLQSLKTSVGIKKVVLGFLSPIRKTIEEMARRLQSDISEASGEEIDAYQKRMKLEEEAAIEREREIQEFRLRMKAAFARTIKAASALADHPQAREIGTKAFRLSIFLREFNRFLDGLRIEDVRRIKERGGDIVTAFMEELQQRIQTAMQAIYHDVTEGDVAALGLGEQEARKAMAEAAGYDFRTWIRNYLGQLRIDNPLRRFFDAFRRPAGFASLFYDRIFIPFLGDIFDTIATYGRISVGSVMGEAIRDRLEFLFPTETLMGGRFGVYAVPGMGVAFRGIFRRTLGDLLQRGRVPLEGLLRPTEAMTGIAGLGEFDFRTFLEQVTTPTWLLARGTGFLGRETDVAVLQAGLTRIFEDAGMWREAFNIMASVLASRSLRRTVGTDELLRSFDFFIEYARAGMGRGVSPEALRNFAQFLLTAGQEGVGAGMRGVFGAAAVTTLSQMFQSGRGQLFHPLLAGMVQMVTGGRGVSFAELVRIQQQIDREGIFATIDIGGQQVTVAEALIEYFDRTFGDTPEAIVMMSRFTGLSLDKSAQILELLRKYWEDIRKGGTGEEQRRQIETIMEEAGQSYGEQFAKALAMRQEALMDLTDEVIMPLLGLLRGVPQIIAGFGNVLTLKPVEGFRDILTGLGALGGRGLGFLALYGFSRFVGEGFASLAGGLGKNILKFVYEGWLRNFIFRPNANIPALSQFFTGGPRGLWGSIKALVTGITPLALGVGVAATAALVLYGVTRRAVERIDQQIDRTRRWREEIKELASLGKDEAGQAEFTRRAAAINRGLTEDLKNITRDYSRWGWYYESFGKIFAPEIGRKSRESIIQHLNALKEYDEAVARRLQESAQSIEEFKRQLEEAYRKDYQARIESAKTQIGNELKETMNALFYLLEQMSLPLTDARRRLTDAAIKTQYGVVLAELAEELPKYVWETAQGDFLRLGLSEGMINTIRELTEFSAADYIRAFLGGYRGIEEGKVNLVRTRFVEEYSKVVGREKAEELFREKIEPIVRFLVQSQLRFFRRGRELPPEKADLELIGEGIAYIGGERLVKEIAKKTGLTEDQVRKIFQELGFLPQAKTETLQPAPPPYGAPNTPIKPEGPGTTRGETPAPTPTPAPAPGPPPSSLPTPPKEQEAKPFWHWINPFNWFKNEAPQEKPAELISRGVTIDRIENQISVNINVNPGVLDSKYVAKLIEEMNRLAIGISLSGRGRTLKLEAIG